MPRGAASPALRSFDSAAARVGAIVLASMALLCFGSLPWSFSRVPPPEGGAPQRRFEVQDLRLSLLPPRWWTLSEADRVRIETAKAGGRAEPGRWLGTDRLGRDMLARALAGGAISMLIGLSAAAIVVVVGTTYGMISGYGGGRVDAVMMRIVDILYGLPSILLVVLLAVAVDGLIDRLGEDPPAALRQSINLVTLLVAIGGVSWLTMARVIRGQVMSLKAQPFMEACRALGIPVRRQLLRHILPNLIGPIVVYATLAVPAAILAESFLSFLGIGIREPLPSWGNMAADGLPELNPIASRWWLLFWPCVLIAMTLLSLNFLGEGLRERFDPRGRAGRATGRATAGALGSGAVQSGPPLGTVGET